ncbi:MAG: hypothetical protein KA369_05745 [Spirochaetes bacterium]|nr:hypothetical protein [Spirochaetota bacterium]
MDFIKSIQTAINKVINKDNTDFTNGIKEINRLFFNLKQERHIRDLLVSLLDKELSNNNYLVISEYPRGKYGQAVDLSIITKNNDDNFLIEIKYQYPGDFKNKMNIEKIKNDIVKRKNAKYNKIKLFILIIQDWQDEKKQFEKYIVPWKLNINIDKYQKINSYDDKIETKIKNYGKSSDPVKVEFLVDKPWKTKYTFLLFYCGNGTE